MGKNIWRKLWTYQSGRKSEGTFAKFWSFLRMSPWTNSGNWAGVNQCSGLIPFDKPHHRLMLVHNPIYIYVTICFGSFQANSLDMYIYIYALWSQNQLILSRSNFPKPKITDKSQIHKLWIAQASHFSGKMSRLVLICGPIVSVACGDPAASPISRSSPWKMVAKDHQNLEVKEVIMKKCSKNWNELDFMTIQGIYHHVLSFTINNADLTMI